MRLTRLIVIALTVVSPLGMNRAVASDAPKHDAVAFEIAPPGPMSPSTLLLDANGHSVTLPRSLGKPLIVNIWATWCGGCVLEMPTLASLQSSYSNRITVLTVSIDDLAHRKDAREFISKYPQLLFYQDPEKQLSANLVPAVQAYPTTIIYDAKGHERYRLLGKTTDWNGNAAHKMIDGLLSGL